MIQKRLQQCYVIDTSALIDLWRVHYAPDVFKSLWSDLGSLVSRHELIAPDEVLAELEAREDQLLEWARDHRQMFKMLDGDQIAVLAEILDEYPPGVADTLSETPIADPFVVALAKAADGKVVSSEKTDKNKVKIPDVCAKFGVPHRSILEFLREKKWTY
ncbi:MAG: DUF4411 family protein [Euryarchaeota archaeon]|nr:DUF4411 family protein [Euryarchaeota archaeon]